MKIALIALVVTFVSGLLFYAIGQPLEIYHYVGILFTTSIVVWTFDQYDEHNLTH